MLACILNWQDKGWQINLQNIYTVHAQSIVWLWRQKCFLWSKSNLILVPLLKPAFIREMSGLDSDQPSSGPCCWVPLDRVVVSRLCPSLWSFHARSWCLSLRSPDQLWRSHPLSSQLSPGESVPRLSTPRLRPRPNWRGIKCERGPELGTVNLQQLSRRYLASWDLL